VRRALPSLVIASGLTLSASRAVAAVTDPTGDDPLLALCRDALLAEIAIAAIAVAGALLGGLHPWRRLGLARGQARVGARGVGWLVLGTLALSHALDALLSLLGLDVQGVLAELPALLAGTRGERLLLVLAALGLAPAIAEELLCRGFLQRALVPRLGPAIGISLAALVFGVLHLDPIHGLFAGLLGLYLGAGAYWVGSTWAAITCHAANNLTALLVAALAPGVPTGPLSLALGLSVAALCAWRVRREAIRDLPER
jgi:membrane protease YdiL (CAAX protease family)